MFFKSWEPGHTSSRTMTSERACKAVSIVIHILIWGGLSVFAYLFSYNKMGIRPVQRGFFCDDQSIHYPYKDDSVGTTELILASVGLPIVIILIIEAIHVIISKEKEYTQRSELFRKYMYNVYRIVGSLLYCSIGVIVFTEILKTLAGRLRPHFLSVCDPDYSKINCSLGYVMEGNDVCRGMDTDKLIDSRKSFPSGHASISFNGAVFMLVYLQMRFIWRQLSLIVALLQFVAVSWAAYASISRVTDHKHHSSDVIAGVIIGTIFALFVIYYISILPSLARRQRTCMPEVNACSNGVTPKCDVNGDTVVEMNNVAQTDHNKFSLSK